jgi:hypothetical protein
MSDAPRILCISSYEKGQAFMRECAALGCHVVLLTVDKLHDADWPRDILEELVTMPDGMSLDQITNTATYLARTRHFDRIVALDEFDMEAAAHLREHMRIPGMGRTAVSHFRDKLAMRYAARAAGINEPEFTRVLFHDEVRAWMDRVPDPSASAKCTTLSSSGGFWKSSATGRASLCWSSLCPAISFTSTRS